MNESLPTSAHIEQLDTLPDVAALQSPIETQSFLQEKIANGSERLQRAGRFLGRTAVATEVFMTEVTNSTESYTAAYEDFNTENPFKKAAAVATVVTTTGALLAGVGSLGQEVSAAYTEASPHRTVTASVETQEEASETSISSSTEDVMIDAADNYQRGFETDELTSSSMTEVVSNYLDNSPDLLKNIDSIQNIHVTGFASAEALDTPDAGLQVQNPENDDLGRQRAEVMAEAFSAQILERTGVDLEQAISINQHETDVTDIQLATLEAMADQHGFENVNALVDMNRDNPDNLGPGVGNYINEVLGDRGATLTAEYEKTSEVNISSIIVTRESVSVVTCTTPVENIDYTVDLTEPIAPPENDAYIPEHPEPILSETPDKDEPIELIVEPKAIIPEPIPKYTEDSKKNYLYGKAGKLQGGFGGATAYTRKQPDRGFNGDRRKANGQMPKISNRRGRQ